MEVKFQESSRSFIESELSLITGDNGRGLVVDAHFEARRAPVDKLDGSFGFNGCYGSVDVFGYYVTAVQHTAGHVLAVARITLDHLVTGFETGVGDFLYRHLLMVGLFSYKQDCLGCKIILQSTPDTKDEYIINDMCTR